MEKELTRNELLALSECLNYLSTKETSIWYQILKNKKKVKVLVDETMELRSEIVEKFSKKDENNEKVKDENGNILVSDPEEANKALTKLGDEIVKIELDQANLSELKDSTFETRYVEPLVDIMLIVD
jgi:hypothetical protein